MLAVMLAFVPAKRTRRPDVPRKPVPTLPAPERTRTPPQGPQPGDRQVLPPR